MTSVCEAMRTVRCTRQFMEDAARLTRSVRSETFRDVIERLAADVALPANVEDRALDGYAADVRLCRIPGAGDLLYEVAGDDVVLVRLLISPTRIRAHLAQARVHIPALLMLANYLKIAFRTLKRRPGYTFINVVGLAIGLACSLLLLLYVREERSYDRFNEDADRIFRVVRQHKTGDSDWVKIAGTAYRLPDLLGRAFPQIEAMVRMADITSLITVDDQAFTSEHLMLADSTVFDVFTIPFVRGDPTTALDTPYSVVLTEAAAQRYFGDADPIGRQVTLNRTRTFTVTGIVRAMPPNAHFHFDMLGSLSSIRGWFSRGTLEEWGATWTWLYLKLDDPSAAPGIQDQLSRLVQQSVALPAGYQLRLLLQPLTSIHLHSDYQGEIEPNGNATYLYLFLVIAGLILLIACINFMNLATARSAWRAREVGVRKVVGARRLHLAGQFLGEAMLLCAMGLVLAVGLVALLLPSFNALAGKALTLPLTAGWFWLGLLGFLLVVGTLAGSYPAFYLSGFRPVTVLKGQAATTGGGVARVRKGLVVFQFAVSIALLVGTTVVYNQLRYVQHARLGFDEDQVLVVPAPEQEQTPRMREAFARVPGVLVASAASDVPSYDLNAWWIEPRDGTVDPILMNVIAADPTFVDLLDIDVVAGRNFSPDRPADVNGALLLNEAAVKQLGLKDPIGAQMLVMHERPATVIGVVRDFHVASLHQAIEPLMISLRPDWFDHVLLKVRPDHLDDTLAGIEAQWKALAPGWPFDYFFLDDQFDALYRADRRVGQIFTYFAILAAFVACLGLFGLSAYTAEQRTKEIGIRKVMGARLAQIVYLLARDFLVLVLFAFLIAAPVAYVAMQRWLDSFAYRAEPGVGIFVLAGVGALLIGIVTVSYQSIRAASTDPVKALRYE